MKARHAMPFGATLLDAGGTRFRLWAPGASGVELELHGQGGGPARRAMHRDAGGWHELVVNEAGAGTRYGFRVPGGDQALSVPDPASRFNPDDIHAPSAVIDPQAYAWNDARWRGRPWHEAVVYEMHVGTFTPQGSFAAARERLPALAALGISAVELLPLADFPGRRNWGYDGVLHYAPDASYGTPDELKAFVDAAHGLGLMVLLDVVYNHFGPEGNYLHAFCPQFFNPAHHTPWGAAINFDGPDNRTVRDFFVHNALYWVEEYRFDGLRLDAVHAIRDDSPRHIACEIGAALRAGPGRERHVHLVLENDANQARYLARDAAGRPACADAQWNDDLHHAAHVLASGERDGYYADYAAAPVEAFGRALAEGFVFQGQASDFRDGERRGEPCTQLPPVAFVSFLQNHDQIGNRAFGERLQSFSNERRLRAALACLLLSPHVPLLFMGEEFAASTPFLFFCDFGPELAAAVVKGRREEFKRFAAFEDEAARERIPDPGAAATFEASKLRWEEREQPLHREWLAEVRALLEARRRHLVPRLAGATGGGRHEVRGELLQVDWPLDAGARWQMHANFGASPVALAQLEDGSLSRKRRAAPSFLDPLGGLPPQGGGLGALTVHAAGLQAAPDGGLQLDAGGVLVRLQAAAAPGVAGDG